MNRQRSLFVLGWFVAVIWCFCMGETTGYNHQLFEAPWSCSNFDRGACTYPKALNLSRPEYQRMHMPIMFAVETNKNLRMCLSEGMTLNPVDLSKCPEKNTLYFRKSSVLNAFDVQNDMYVLNTSFVLSNRSYYVQVAPLDDNDVGDTRFTLNAYYTNPCDEDSPYQSLYGECMRAVELGSGSKPKTYNDVLYPMIPNLYRFNPKNNHAGRITLTISLFNGNNNTDNSSSSTTNLSDEDKKKMKGIFAWVRKGNTPILYQGANDPTEVLADYSNLRDDLPVGDRNDGKIVIKLENPSMDNVGWFLAIQSYYDVRISLDYQVTYCNYTQGDSFFYCGERCDVIPIDATHYGSNVSSHSQIFYSSVVTNDTVFSVRKDRLIFGIANADFHPGAPIFYVARGYVPSSHNHAVASLDSMGWFNFIDVSVETTGSNSSYYYPSTFDRSSLPPHSSNQTLKTRDIESNDGSSSNNGSSNNELESIWYITVPHHSKDWVIWVNEPCASNCSNVGVCIENMGYCSCNDKKYSGSNCSIKNNFELIAIPVMCGLGLLLGVVIVFVLALYVRRKARSSYTTA